jgi:hypothetical protein
MRAGRPPLFQTMEDDFLRRKANEDDAARAAYEAQVTAKLATVHQLVSGEVVIRPPGGSSSPGRSRSPGAAPWVGRRTSCGREGGGEGAGQGLTQRCVNIRALTSCLICCCCLQAHCPTARLLLLSSARGHWPGADALAAASRRAEEA